MAESMFGYNITRPYPFRWFSAVAVAYTFDQPPVQALPWYYRLVALQSNALDANCTPVNFPVNSKFFTNQSGLTYTLDAIWTDKRDALEDDGEDELYSPILSYLNKPFRNCSIFLVNLDMQELDRDAHQVFASAWGTVVRAFVTCSLQHKTSGQVTFVNLTTSFDAIPQGDLGPPYSKQQWLVSSDRHKRASLWWGESLLSGWWATLAWTMIRTTQENDYEAPFRKCLFRFTRDTNSTNIMDTDFMLAGFFGIKDLGNGDFEAVYNGFPDGQPVAQLFNNSFANGTVVLPETAKLARTMYSTVMIDLGQDTNPQENILLRGESLQEFSKDIIRSGHYYPAIQPGPAKADYDTLKSSTGELGTTPSVISTKYTCQIPTRKPTGSLIFSILVADLVFLQAAWKLLYTLIVGWCIRKRVRVNYCEGCIKELTNGQSENSESALLESTRYMAMEQRSGSPLLESTRKRSTRQSDSSLLESESRYCRGTPSPEDENPPEYYHDTDVGQTYRDSR